MLGVYGGTFDPVHFGHLRTAFEVRERLGLSELRLIPCHLPPHRGEPTAAPEQRLEMLRLAVAGEPSFRIDTRELDREGPSYMVDTLTSIRGEIGDAPLCLVVGTDAFLGLASWRRWRDLFDLAHLVIVLRPGYEAQPEAQIASFIEGRTAASAEVLRERPCGLVFRQEVTLLDISATCIRRMIAEGRSPRYLLPDAVWARIQTRGLYR